MDDDDFKRLEGKIDALGRDQKRLMASFNDLNEEVLQRLNYNEALTKNAEALGAQAQALSATFQPWLVRLETEQERLRARMRRLEHPDE